MNISMMEIVAFLLGVGTITLLQAFLVLLNRADPTFNRDAKYCSECGRRLFERRNNERDW